MMAAPSFQYTVSEAAMKNILLLVHDDQGQEARFQAALDLARALSGHLSCVEVTVPPVAVGDFYSGAGAAMLTEMEYEREAANAATIEERLASEDVPWSRVEIVDTIAGAVIDAATLADLIVLNRQLDSFPQANMRDIASRVLTHARKPIVAVPETLQRFEFGRALIAWDGGESCSSTMRACVPLLALANDVEVFTARDATGGADPSDAAEYLSRHNIHANVVAIENRSLPADQLIAEEAARWQADYVVMGAYGRGRLMEAFGGVTKRMLTNSKLPLVLGH